MDCQRCQTPMLIEPDAIPTKWCNHCAQTMLAEAKTLEKYSGKDGHRQWGEHASTWLYPGDVVLVVSTKPGASKS